MRTDAQKLQLMKASFFEHDDVYSTTSDITIDRQKSPDQMVPISIKQQYKVSIEQEEDDMFIGQLEKDVKQTTVCSQILKMIGPQSQPLVDCPRLLPYDIGNLCSSSLYSSSIKKNNVSIPFFMGKRFKIGWTKGNGYTKLSSPTTQALFDGQRCYSNHAITIQEFKPSTSLVTAEKFKKSIQKHLEIELQCDKKNVTSSSECHWLESGSEISGLHEHHQFAQKISKENGEQIDSSVWSLMNVLWSKINEELEPQVT